MNSFLLLVVFPTAIVFSSLNNQAFAESASIFITRDGLAKVSETFDVKTTVSRFDVIPLGKTITDIFAYDEYNVVLKTDFDETKIRIESLGASIVNLDYNSDVLSEENGLWNITYDAKETTSIFLPDSSDLVNINTIPIGMDEKQITMPPGDISLTYTLRSIDSHNFLLDDDSTIEIMTTGKIKNFQTFTNKILFLFDEKNSLLIILPKSFLQEIPQIQINETPVKFEQYYQNSTHHWIGIEPSTTGSLEITEKTSQTIPDSQKSEIVSETSQKSKLESEPLQTSSEGGGCLIATATFDSEFAPQVQKLRELRDNTILRTQSGSAFMSGFNSIYYSFSPQIADLEREYPIFKEVVKFVITPMLLSLSILSYGEIDSEQEMLGYGIGIIMLNIGMYVAMPAFMAIKITSYFQHCASKRHES